MKSFMQSPVPTVVFLRRYIPMPIGMVSGVASFASESRFFLFTFDAVLRLSHGSRVYGFAGLELR